MSIIRVAWHTFDAHHQTFFMRRCDTDFNTKFVWVTHLTFGDSFNFRRMQAVELILICTLLAEQALYFGECCFYSVHVHLITI